MPKTVDGSNNREQIRRNIIGELRTILGDSMKRIVVELERNPEYARLIHENPDTIATLLLSCLQEATDHHLSDFSEVVRMIKTTARD